MVRENGERLRVTTRLENSSVRSRIPICKHSTRGEISSRLIDIVMVMEFFLQRKLKFTSGVRCKICNEIAKGSATSEHITAHAVDVAIANSRQRIDVARAALQTGCNRIGIDKEFIHVGVDVKHAGTVLWIY